MTVSNGALAASVAEMVVAAAGDPKGGADAAATTFTIGELSREFGVTLRALRFYESKGLIAPRRRGSSRLYSGADRDRLGLVLGAKRLGFTLVEISRMVAASEAPGRDLDLSPDKCLEQIALLEDQKRGIELALVELRRIHAALSARPAVPVRVAS